MVGVSTGPGSYSRRSPGWQSSSRQMASNVEKRIARALLVLRIERFGRAIPIRSANSVRVIPRSRRTRSSCDGDGHGASLLTP